ncbi:hypothetical protein Hypma_013709 [Hypsizygus marmoreus]|uniref:Uncharacterized protein n=1 Tax=Hypsizygus marmoreus TaxID=39966 RepID=A0A369JAY1_HYPMA|nr:hypothetical protein Hypma_013709 [Hypsizygus marmoreus]
MEDFRAVPGDPSAAIRFDLEARDRYAKSPFRMDDHNLLQLPLLAQMFRASFGAASPPSSSHGMHNLHAPNSSPTKRGSTPCRSWNYDSCEDPCENHQKHGSGSECGAKHRARDDPTCFILLQARIRKGAGEGWVEGGAGVGRA